MAALLLGTTAMAQTAAPAPAEPAPAAPAAAAPAPAPAPAPAAAAPAAAAPAYKFALKGFVSMSAAYQTGTFSLSEGQQSLMSTTNAGSTVKVKDADSLTFDVRQSRFNFSVQGPTVLFGATPTGVLEIDFFQGYGAGNFGDVSLLNRLRVAYGELNWGAHKLQLGQQNDLVFAMAPTSLSHIAFPLGYFTGNIGWRRPGVFGYHTFAPTSDVKLEGAWEVGRSQAADQAAGIGGAASVAPGGISPSEASGGPAFEARVTASYAKLLTLFVGGHVQNTDLTGYGAVSGGAGLTSGTNVTNHIITSAFNAGLKLTLPLPSDMLLTVQGTGFTGKNVQPLIANFSTASVTTGGIPAFRTGPQSDPDVETMGWWAQGGFNLTKEWSAWVMYGQQKIDEADFVRAGYGVNAAYQNTTTNVIVMYRTGGVGFSGEWINFNTKYSSTVDAAANKILTNHSSKSDQYMLTANYFF